MNQVDRTHAVEVRTSKHLFLDLPTLEPRLVEWIQRSSVDGSWTANSVHITNGAVARTPVPRMACVRLTRPPPPPHLSARQAG